MFNNILQKKSYLSGIGLTLLSCIFVALIALFAKNLSLQMGLLILLPLRFILPAILLWWMALLGKVPPLPTTNLRLHLIRTVFGVSSQIEFFYCLVKSSMLIATLLFMTGPIFVPIITRITQRHPITLKNWLSISIGFIGVIFVLNPSLNSIHPALIIGLLSGFLTACSQVTFHKICKQVSAESATFVMYNLAAIGSVVFLAIAWHWIKLPNIGSNNIYSMALLLIALAAAGISNQNLRAKAYSKVKKAASLTPFLYMSIVFSGLFDWIFFNKLPDIEAIIGAVLIIVSGLVMLLGNIPRTTSHKSTNQSTPPAISECFGRLKFR